MTRLAAFRARIGELVDAFRLVATQNRRAEAGGIDWASPTRLAAVDRMRHLQNRLPLWAINLADRRATQLIWKDRTVSHPIPTRDDLVVGVVVGTVAGRATIVHPPGPRGLAVIRYPDADGTQATLDPDREPFTILERPTSTGKDAL